jgi:hypothetical protein
LDRRWTEGYSLIQELSLRPVFISTTGFPRTTFSIERMKKRSCLLAALFISATGVLFAQVSGPGQITPGPDSTPAYFVSDRGPHTRVWQKVVAATNQPGQVVTTTNQAYVELATGLNYWDPAGRQWLEIEGGD